MSSSVQTSFSIVNSLYPDVDQLIGNSDLISEAKSILFNADFDNEESGYVYPIVSFQVCLSWKSTTIEPKQDLTSKKNEPDQNQNGHSKPYKTPINAKTWLTPTRHYADPDNPKRYEGISWHTVKAPLCAIREFIRQGFVLRYGIKERGNDKNKFESCQFVAFDLDADPTITWQDTRDLCETIGIVPYLIYYSPSGNPENNKLRLIILLDRSVDQKEYKKLNCRISSLFINATTLKDATRFWYGTLLDIPYTNSNPNPVNSVDHLFSILEYVEGEDKEDAEETKKKTQSRTKKEQPSELSDYSQQIVSEYLYNNIVIPMFDGDLSAMVDTWINHFIEQGHELYTGEWFHETKDGTALEAWNGTNPFRGSKTGKGDSFTLSIRASDHTLVYCVDHSDNNGGSLPELYYFLSRGVYDGVEPGSQWKSIVDEICKLHSVPTIAESVAAEKTEALRTELAEKIGVDKETLPSFIKIDDKGRVQLDICQLVEYYFEVERSEKLYYDETQNRNVFMIYNEYLGYWKELLIDDIRADIKEFLRIIDRVILSLPGNEDKTSIITGKVLNEIMLHLRSTSRQYARPPLLTDKNFVAFDNGLYNVVKKELIPFTHRVFTRTKHPFPFAAPMVNTHGKHPYDVYMDVYSRVCVKGEQAAQLNLNWLICASQNRAFYTGCMNYLVGESRAGKTTIRDILRNIVGTERSLEASTTRFFSKDSRFELIRLKDKTVVFFDEFSWNPSLQLELFKTLFPGNPDVPYVEVDAEGKGTKHLKFNFSGGFMATSEKLPMFGKKLDNGTKNRILYTEVRRVSREEYDLSEQFVYLKTSADFPCWLVMQDANELIYNYFPSIRNQSWYSEVQKKVAREANDFTQFLNETLEYTGDKTDTVSAKELLSTFYNYIDLANIRSRHQGLNTTNFGNSMREAIFDLYGLTKEQCKGYDSSKNSIYIGFKWKPDSIYHHG